MKTHDFDKERAEQSHSLLDFMKLYNKDLPLNFPRASVVLLNEFRDTHANIFKSEDIWSLDQHRKKVMDWLCALRPA